MNRRDFLAATAGLAGAGILGRSVWAADLPRDVRITRIVSFELIGRRPKYVGKNSRREDHGRETRERMVRIYTDAGIEGLATSWDTQEHCAELLGKRLSDFYRRDEQRMVGPFERYTCPLWDLAGKALGKPVYELLGGAGPKRVAVYDGSIYFIDLVPEHAAAWKDQVRRELDMSLEAGHRAFKIKIGRGAKWMSADEGYQRDLEVLRLIRGHVGNKIELAVDANDGYDLPRTKRLLSDLPDFDFAFIEEMFPEDVEMYLELKAFIKDRGWRTLIADGENTRRPEQMQSWVDARAVDILQGDMNLYGFEDILKEAAMGRAHGIRIAPHNWGSLVGYYLQLQVGRAITNFYRAEQDPIEAPALVAEGYAIKDGTSSVPEAPGLGLSINEKAFADGAKVVFDIKA